MVALPPCIGDNVCTKRARFPEPELYSGQLPSRAYLGTQGELLGHAEVWAVSTWNPTSTKAILCVSCDLVCGGPAMYKVSPFFYPLAWY